MVEKRKTYLKEEMNEKEQRDFSKLMKSLSYELGILHQQSIDMAHRAQHEASHAFLNC